jgi:hypothetical protein
MESFFGSVTLPHLPLKKNSKGSFLGLAKILIGRVMEHRDGTLF